MIKNVIFDWSGVINDNKHLVHAAAMEFFKSCGLKPLAFAEFQNEVSDNHLNFYNKYFPELSIEEVVNWYTEAYRKVAAENPPRAYPGMVEVINKLYKNDINQIILSSDNIEHLENELVQYELKKIFKEINHGVQNKSEGLIEILQRNNFLPDETIIIGDTGNELRAGESVRMQTGAVTWGLGTKEFFHKHVPNYIFESPQEITELILN